jgi:hypothetical protein
MVAVMSDEEPLDGEVVPGLPDPDDHAIKVQPTVFGKLAACSCLQWEGWWNGPRSERFVREEHARHVEVARRAETSQ